MGKLDINDYKDTILEMAAQGYQSNYIADKIGVSASVMCQWRKQLGISPKKFYKLPSHIVEQIEKMYTEDGVSRKEIARTLGINVTTVSNAIMNYGLQRTFHTSCDIKKLHMPTVEDPIFYVEHKPSMAKCSYHGKQYRDMTAGILGG